MKNIITSVLVVIISMTISISCQNKVTEIAPISHGGSARDGINLAEVIVTARYTNYNDYTGLADNIYTLSIGNDYHATSNPLTAFNEEYAGEDIDIPYIVDLVLTKLNSELAAHHMSAFNDQEMTLLRTLKVVQIFQIYTAILAANNLGDVAMRMLHEPVDDGYSNAFRHFYLAFGVARAVGPDIAAQYLIAHEANQIGLSTQMDTNNNEYAIYVYRNNLSGNNFVSYNFLLGLAQNGYIWTIQNGVLGQFPLTVPPGSQGPRT